MIAAVGMVVDGNEASTINHQATDAPVGAAAVDLTIDVAITNDALQCEAVKQQLGALAFGVGRPDEAFDGHSSKATPRLG